MSEIVKKDLILINKDCVDYVITSDGELLRMTNTTNEKLEVTIPSVFKSGHKIVSIGSDVCCGKFSKIVIPDEITKIKKCAFRKASVKRVCWSGSCNTIPKECFWGSSVRYISNIHNVKKIESGAFAETHFRVLLARYVQGNPCKMLLQQLFGEYLGDRRHRKNWRQSV